MQALAFRWRYVDLEDGKRKKESRVSTDTLCLYVKADALVKILKAPSGKVKLQPVVGQAEVSDSKY